MTFEQLGNIGEFVAAIATLVTLIYLARQIRQNTRAVRAASHHSVTDSFNHINTVIGTDTRAARTLRLGLERLENLTEDEQFSFAFLMLGYMRVFETLFYQTDIGAVEEQLFRSETNSLKWVFRYRGALDWWNNNEMSFSPEFRSYIEEIIKGLRTAA